MGLIPKPAPSIERIKMIKGINEEKYWRELKHQYAGMAMQGMLSNVSMIIVNEAVRNGNDRAVDIIARTAFVFATALIEKLKEESNGN